MKKGFALLAVGGFLFYRNYLPFRKAVNRTFDPSWKALSRPLVFSPDEEIAEEQNLFVSSTVMRDACDHIWLEESTEPPGEFFEMLPYGSVLFVNLRHMRRFLDEVLPAIKSEVVVVAGCDTRSPRVQGYERLYKTPKLLHCFLQNCDFVVPVPGRVTHLPLGLNFHKLDPRSPNQSRDMGQPSRPGNQQLTLRAFRKNLPPLEDRPLKVYANFHLNMDTFLRDRQAVTRHTARKEALRALKPCSWVDWEARQIPRNLVWQRYRDYSFEASPRGNGWDCHRTWEALLMKTIPIVKRSPIDPVYQGLPVLLVDDWSEVTLRNLQTWRTERAPALEGPIPEALFSRYWIQKFFAWKRLVPS